MSSVIVVTTPRLRLRRMTTDDAAFMFELLNQPSFLRFIGDRKARDLDGARAYITERVIAAWDQQGFGMDVMELADTGEPVGICGLVKRPTLAEVDVGYAMLERHWGRGYAREAVGAVLRHAAGSLKLQRVLAITSPDNEASMALLRDLGFLEQERLTGVVDGDSVLFALELRSPLQPTPAR